MERKKIISVAMFSAAIAGGGVAGVILGSPASGSAATPSPMTFAARPHRFGFGRGFRDGAVLDAAAKAIGVSSDTLRSELRSGQTIAQVAKSKNVSTQSVIDAMVAAAKQELASEEANLESHLTELITNAVNGTFERPMPPNGAFGPDRGFGFRGGFGLDAAAKAIGVSTGTLLHDIRSGQTIAQVATSKNVATQTVIDAMVAAAKKELAAQVKAGHLTADQQANIEAHLTEMITNQVNGTFPRPGFRGAPGGWWHAHGGSGPDGSGGAPSDRGTTESAAPTI